MIDKLKSNSYYSNSLRKMSHVLFTIILSAQFCTGQRNMILSDQEGFMKLTDDVIKSEIASFSLKGSSLVKMDSVSRIKLEEVPAKKCSDKFIVFEKGNLYNSEIIVSIEVENDSLITVVRLLSGRYGQYFLPDSAIAGISAPDFCTKSTKRGKPIKSNCKVYRSEDKRRVYIYMRNGKGADRYEVTWIIQDEKYYARVIDPI